MDDLKTIAKKLGVTGVDDILSDAAKSTFAKGAKKRALKVGSSHYLGCLALARL